MRLDLKVFHFFFNSSGTQESFQSSQHNPLNRQDFLFPPSGLFHFHVLTPLPLWSFHSYYFILSLSWLSLTHPSCHFLSHTPTQTSSVHFLLFFSLVFISLKDLLYLSFHPRPCMLHLYIVSYMCIWDVIYLLCVNCLIYVHLWLSGQSFSF